MLSIIIPTLNEEKYLPKLLTALKNQTYRDFEVIVVDGHSSDNTVQIAKKAGCKVYVEPKKPGHPGMARNIGAKHANGEYLLFLDADVTFDNEFLYFSYNQFVKNNYVIATCKFTSDMSKIGDFILNLYISFFSFFSYPRAPGFFIMTKKKIFLKKGGFDENLLLAEDHNLAKRISKEGKFGIIDNLLHISMRRWEKENKFHLMKKYLWVEFNLMIGREIYKTPFKYEFGKF